MTKVFGRGRYEVIAAPGDSCLVALDEGCGDWPQNLRYQATGTTLELVAPGGILTFGRLEGFPHAVLESSSGVILLGHLLDGEVESAIEIRAK